MPKPELFITICHQFNCELQCGRINNMFLNKHGSHYIRTYCITANTKFNTFFSMPYTSYSSALFLFSLSRNVFLEEKPYRKVKSPKFTMRNRYNALQRIKRKNKKKERTKSKISKQSFHAYQQTPMYSNHNIHIWQNNILFVCHRFCTRLVLFDTLTTMNYWILQFIIIMYYQWISKSPQRWLAFFFS